MFPILEDVKRFWGNPSLENVIVVGAQHILGCTAELIMSLASMGVSYQNIYLIGKCYSTSKNAVLDLRKLGVYVSSLSSRYLSDEKYDETYKKSVQQFVEDVLSKIRAQNFHKIVVLDDGGVLIKALSERLNQEELMRVMGVEQTSSGFHFLTRARMKFPVINVARSEAKLNYESPFIAQNCLSVIKAHLGTKALEDLNVTIIGNGAIGQSFLQELTSNSCTLVDPLTSSQHQLLSSLHRADLIIGCTGKTSIPSKLFRHLKQNVILVSASSSDREFDALKIRRRFPVNSNSHATYRVSEGITLLNSGFPINFTGKRFVSNPNDIQLTMGLLFGGVLQCVCNPSYIREFLDLDYEFQKFLIHTFLSTRYISDSQTFDPDYAENHFRLMMGIG